MSKRVDRSAVGAIGLTSATVMVGLLGVFAAGVPGLASEGVAPYEPSAQADPAERLTHIDASAMVEVAEAGFSISTDEELQARVEAMLAANRPAADAAVARVAPLVEARSHVEFAAHAFGGLTQTRLEPLAPMAQAELDVAPIAIALAEAPLLEPAPQAHSGRIVLAALPVERPGGFGAAGE